MNQRSTVFLNSLAFVIGFSVVFSLVGVLLQTALERIAFDAVNVLRVIGGSVIILFGILLIASLKHSIPFLRSEHKLKVKRFRNSYATSFVFGSAFAIGWTPCVGFILGAIYALAATSPGAGFALLLTYSLGLGITFLFAGAFFSRIAGFIRRSQSVIKFFNIIGGLFLIAVGLLVVTNYIGIIATFLIPADASVNVSGQLNFTIAFIAGLLSFFSPCILPLVPAFLSYMAGTTAIEAKGTKKK